MKFYRINDTALTSFAGTIAAAHKAAKSGHFNKLDVQIDEVEVPTDKTGVLQLLTDDPAKMEFKVLRSWQLTARGGLEEVKGEAA